MRVYKSDFKGNILRLRVDGRQTKFTLKLLLERVNIGFDSLSFVRYLPRVGKLKGRKIDERHRGVGSKLFEVRLNKSSVAEVEELKKNLEENGQEN